MRRTHVKVYLSILFALLFVVMFPATALAAQENAVVLGNSYTLLNGQTLNDDLFILGGTVNLMEGSTINGNVILLGGSADAAGTVNGSMVALGGRLNLSSTFILTGNLTSAGALINRDPGAQIRGQVNSNETSPTIIIPGQVQIPNVNITTDPFLKVASFFLRLFLWVLAAMVLAMFIPSQLRRIAHTAISQPLISGGMGLLTAIIAPIVLVLLAITICLIPVSLLGFIVLAIASIYGMIALGYEVGKRISSTSQTEWHPALSAGLGTLLQMAVLNGIEFVIPCFGAIPKILVGLVGLGAVLLTQFGMKDYSLTPSQPAGDTASILPPG